MLWSSAFLILILNKKQIQDSSDSIRWIYPSTYAHNQLPFPLIFFYISKAADISNSRNGNSISRAGNI